MKRNLLIIFLILSLLSIVVTIMIHFEVFRYIKLHISSPETYITKYLNLPKARKDNKVVISFMTLKKLDKIIPTLNSILDQTCQVDMIALNLIGTNNIIPKYITHYINIFENCKDYKSNTSIIPTLFREKEADTIIIVIQDDQIYEKSMIENILDDMDENPGKIITNKTVIGLCPSMLSANVVNRKIVSTDLNWIYKNALKGVHNLSKSTSYKKLELIKN